MARSFDTILTMFAPMVWGSTYYVTTQFLPQDIPLTLAVLRALPAGILLMLFVRKYPSRKDLLKIFTLGAFNFAIFWTLLFIAAYRLPGGVAATVNSTQAFFTIFLSAMLLHSNITSLSVSAAIAGVLGVSLLVLEPDASFDLIGLLAGIGSAFSMAAGTVLSRKWKPKVNNLTFTAWQLCAGGILLLPLSFFLEPDIPTFNNENWMGILYLTLIGGAGTYVIWFNGVAKIEPSAISTLVFLSPLTAVMLGFFLLDESLSIQQTMGMLIIFASIWVSQRDAHTNQTAALKAM